MLIIALMLCLAWWWPDAFKLFMVDILALGVFLAIWVVVWTVIIDDDEK